MNLPLQKGRATELTFEIQDNSSGLVSNRVLGERVVGRVADPQVLNWKDVVVLLVVKSERGGGGFLGENAGFQSQVEGGRQRRN